MNPSGDQGLGNRSRQIGREGMRVCGAWRQSPPGEEVGSGIRVTFPEIQKSIDGHGLFFVAIQHAEGERANSQWQPKGDATIGKRNNDRITPRNAKGGEGEGHDAFNNADAGGCGGNDQEKIGDGKTADDRGSSEWDLERKKGSH